MIIYATPEELAALIERLQGRTGTTVRIPLEVSGDDLAKAVWKATDGNTPTAPLTPKTP